MNEYYFSSNLRYLREKNGIEQLDLAERLGRKSASAVSEWEKGIRIPDVGTLDQIATIFKVSLNDLMKTNLEIKENPAYELLISMGHSEEDLNETLIQSNVTFGDSLHVKAKLSKVESQLIEDYRSLDDYGKETVDIALERELKRCQAMDIKLNAAHELPNATEDGKARDNEKIDKLLRDKK